MAYIITVDYDKSGVVSLCIRENDKVLSLGTIEPGDEKIWVLPSSNNILYGKEYIGGIVCDDIEYILENKPRRG